MRGRFSLPGLLLLPPLLALAACWQPQPDPPQPTTSATPSPDASATGGARQVQEETETYLFEYSYPLEAGAIGGLAAWLDARLAEKRSSLAAEAARGQREARDNGFP